MTTWRFSNVSPTIEGFQMSSDESGSAVQLDQLEPGDEITVSARKTPMEVDNVEPTPTNSGVTVETSNQHGRYRLRSHRNGTTSFRTSGQLVAEDVEVTRL